MKKGIVFSKKFIENCAVKRHNFSKKFIENCAFMVKIRSRQLNRNLSKVGTLKKVTVSHHCLSANITTTQIV